MRRDQRHAALIKVCSSRYCSVAAKTRIQARGSMSVRALSRRLQRALPQIWGGSVVWCMWKRFVTDTRTWKRFILDTYRCFDMGCWQWRTERRLRTEDYLVRNTFEQTGAKKMYIPIILDTWMSRRRTTVVETSREQVLRTAPRNWTTSEDPMTTWRTICFCCVCIVLTCACENGEPASLLQSCLAPAIATVRSTGTSSTVTCDLGKETVLVALSSREMGADQLQALGLSAAAAETVRQGDIPAPYWCAVEDVPRTDKPAAGETDKRLASRGGCLHSEVAIPKAMLVRARVVSVSLEKSGQDVAMTKIERSSR
jgi:hypothetical protein